MTENYTENIDMFRFEELINELTRIYKNDYWLEEYNDKIGRNLNLNDQIKKYNLALYELDIESWLVLKQKLIKKFNQPENNRGKYDFFSTMNEAFAYKYLKISGSSKLKIIVEGDKENPDISYETNGKNEFCEVKTINISDQEIVKMNQSNKVQSDEDIYNIFHEGKELSIDCNKEYSKLSLGFFNKLKKDLEKASSQISKDNNGSGIIFIIIHFDDFTHYFIENYIESIKCYMRNEWNSLRVYFMIFSNEECLYKHNM